MDRRREQMRKRRRRKRLIRRILLIFLVVAIGIGAGITYLRHRVSKAIKKGDVSFQDMQLDAATVYDKDIINILLIGADSREEWNDSGRSDSSMIATLDLKNGQLKLTSLMRDMYIDIPGHEKNRFNAAYKFGGVALLNETIAQNFQVRLDGYVIVDFAAFRDVIDKLGGVEITLTDKEANYLNDAYHGKITVEEGTQVLTGKEALAYTRIRQVPTVDGAYYDFGRTERQRRVLDSIFSQLKDQSFTSLMNILTIVFENVTTDLETTQIESLVFSILKIEDKEIKQFSLPVADGYTDISVVLPATSTEAKVLDIDVEKNREAIQNFIFEKYGESTLDDTISEEELDTTSDMLSDTTLDEIEDSWNEN